MLEFLEYAETDDYTRAIGLGEDEPPYVAQLPGLGSTRERYVTQIATPPGSGSLPDSDEGWVMLSVKGSFLEERAPATTFQFRLGLGVVVGQSRTFGGLSEGMQDAYEAQLKAENDRRVFLLHKEHERGLKGPEAAELGQLQQKMERHLSAVSPLPFEKLERLEALAERLEADERADQAQ